jgi:hypothetical protein
MTPEQLDYQLAFIGNVAARRLAKAASRAGAKVLARRQRLLAPMPGTAQHATGRLRNSIRDGSMKDNGLIVGSKAGFDVGRRQATDSEGTRQESGNHGHLYVLGTELRWTGFRRDRRKGHKFELFRNKNEIRFRGRAPAHLPSFIASAAESGADEVREAMVHSLSTNLPKEITKQGV